MFFRLAVRLFDRGSFLPLGGYFGPSPSPLAHFDSPISCNDDFPRDGISGHGAPDDADGLWGGRGFTGDLRAFFFFPSETRFPRRWHRMGN